MFEAQNSDNNLEDILKASVEEFDAAQLQQAQQNSELVALQSRIIESAQKQSEDEHVRKAIAESLEGVEQQNSNENDMNAAIQASLQSSERVFESDLDVSGVRYVRLSLMMMLWIASHTDLS